MNRLFLVTIVTFLLGLPSIADAQVSYTIEEQTFHRDTTISKVLGSLPKPGDLSDVLRCKAANEVFWTTLMQDDPYSPEAHEAKRNAGWYAEVALWVFEVENSMIFDAINAAKSLPKEELLNLLKQCKKAPDKWRE